MQILSIVYELRLNVIELAMNDLVIAIMYLKNTCCK